MTRIVFLLVICLGMCNAQVYRHSTGPTGSQGGDNIVIYTDGLTSPWSIDANGTTVDASNSEHAIGGTSVKVIGSAWQSFDFRNGAWGSTTLLDASLYQSITFSAYTTGATLYIYLEDAGGTRVGSGQQFDLASGWTSKTINFSDLGASVQFGVVGLQFFYTDATIWIDNLTLVHK